MVVIPYSTTPSHAYRLPCYPPPKAFLCITVQKFEVKFGPKLAQKVEHETNNIVQPQKDTQATAELRFKGAFVLATPIAMHVPTASNF